ncbi:MAG: hypothetical protein ACOC1K_02590 [Nanoarchaeota archaeon]
MESYEEVEVNLTDEEFETLNKIAEEHGITFDEFCAKVLTEYIENFEEEREDG